MLLHFIDRETGTTTNITDLVAKASINGEYRNACRTLDFDIVGTEWNITIPRVDIKLGDNIGLIENNKLFFYGVVWSITKDTTQTTIQYHCKDFGVYLLKNKHTGKFKGESPESITRKICSKFGISVGSLAETGATISRKFNANTLYDVIMTAYNLSSTGEYMIRFTGKDLNVIKKGAIVAEKQLEKWSDLLTANNTETLDSMVNTVYVMDDKGESLIDTIQNKDDLIYGLLSETINKEKDSDSKENKTDSKKSAKKATSKKEKKKKSAMEDLKFYLD